MAKRKAIKVEFVPLGLASTLLLASAFGAETGDQSYEDNGVIFP